MTALTTTTLILLAVTLFHIGLLIGWIVSDNESITSESRIRTFVALIITLGWITATVAGILVASYSVSPLLHGLMGAIVGYFFTKDGLNFKIGGE